MNFDLTSQKKTIDGIFSREREIEREREKENDALLLFFYCVRATTRDVYLISVSSSTRLYINTWGEENHPCVCTQYNHKVHQITECEI